ncbi:MAG: LptF/LptG family permease [Pseudomonadota bacterium]
MFVTRNLVISFAMIAILGVLDALSKGDLLPPDAGLGDNLRFMFLRAPLLYEQVFSFAFLLSLLVTYVMLIRRNELVAIAGAGMSGARQIKALVPIVLLMSVASLVLIDQAAPRAQQALTSWLGPEAVTKNSEPLGELWLADEDVLVRIKTVEKDQLFDLTFVERIDRGRVSSVSFAEEATADDDGWRLSNVTQVRFDDNDVNPPQYWTSSLTPETLRLLSLEPRYLSVTDLWDLSQLQGSGNRSSSAYLVWIFSRLALPIAAIGFLIITVSTMQKFGRNPNAELTLVAVMAGGFVYVVVDNISKTLPENSRVDPALAALAPVVCLLLVGFLLASRSTKN